MMHKIELKVMILSAFASTFAQDLVAKVIITTVAMIIGTTAAFYWRRFLEKRNKK